MDCALGSFTSAIYVNPHGYARAGIPHRSLFGFVVFATVIEIGILKKTFSGLEPKLALGELSKRNFQTASIFGAGSGITTAFIFV